MHPRARRAVRLLERRESLVRAWVRRLVRVEPQCQGQVALAHHLRQSKAATHRVEEKNRAPPQPPCPGIHAAKGSPPGPEGSYEQARDILQRLMAAHPWPAVSTRLFGPCCSATDGELGGNPRHANGHRLFWSTICISAPSDSEPTRTVCAACAAAAGQDGGGRTCAGPSAPVRSLLTRLRAWAQIIIMKHPICIIWCIVHRASCIKHVNVHMLDACACACRTHAHMHSLNPPPRDRVPRIP